MSHGNNPIYACPLCHERVYKSSKPVAGYNKINVGGQPTDPQVDIDGNMYHRTCAKCNTRSIAITPDNFENLSTKKRLYSTEFAILICKSCMTTEEEPAVVTVEDQASKVATPSKDHVLANAANKQDRDRTCAESFMTTPAMTIDNSDSLCNRKDPSSFSNYQDFNIESLKLVIKPMYLLLQYFG